MSWKIGGTAPPRARFRKGATPALSPVPWFGARLHVYKTHLEISSRAWRLVRMAATTSPVIRWKGPPPAAG